jgi:hypothetical protein
MVLIPRFLRSLATPDPGPGGDGLVSGAWGHWDLSETDSISLSGSTILQLDDLTGNGQHLVRSGAGTPQYGAEQLNGIDVATLGSQTLSRAHGLTVDQPYSINVLARLTSTSTRHIELGTTTNYLLARSSASQEYIWAGTTLSTPASTLGTWFVWTGIANGNSGLAQRNAASPATGPTGTRKFTGALNLRYLSFAEMVIYHKALSEAEIAANVAHLMDKWGL